MIGFSILRELNGLQSEVDAVFGALGQEQARSNARQKSSETHHYPKATLSEDVDNFYLAALIPGINPNTMDINLTGNSLALSGERNYADLENISWQRQERNQGKFLRTLELPLEVDTNRITAEYTDGVLQVLLPKAEAAKPKRISIKMAS